MKRTQVQLDEATYEALRARAFEQGRSMAAVIRESLHQYFAVGPATAWKLEDLTFIGSGRSSKSGLEPVSERHDEALAEDFGQ
jgi:hypothetical protein